jgi:hypothetical protein
MADKEPTITVPVKEYDELTKRVLPLYHTERKPSGSWKSLVTISKKEYEELTTSTKIIDDKQILEMVNTLELIIAQLKKWMNG